MEACDAAGLSLMCGRPEQAWGYALQDLDGDGAPELLIGNGREIFDLYALQDGAPKKLLTGWERNAYVLCEDGTIYNTARAARRTRSLRTMRSARARSCR